MDETLYHGLALADLCEELIISILAQVRNSPECVLHRQTHLLAVHESPQDVEELLSLFRRKLELQSIVLQQHILILLTHLWNSGQIAAAPH